MSRGGNYLEKEEKFISKLICGLIDAMQNDNCDNSTCNKSSQDYNCQNKKIGMNWHLEAILAVNVSTSQEHENCLFC